MIPIKIIITSQNKILLDSVDDTVQSLDISGVTYSDIVKMEHIIQSEQIHTRALQYKSSSLVEQLQTESKNNSVVFYLSVCGQFLFIIEDDRDIIVVEE